MNRTDTIVSEYKKNGGPSAVIICGPTCSGKSSLALETAGLLDGEIVSCDSMQIYRYMDIGTAKPSPEDTRRVPHHMIDVVDPWENYSAFLYKNDASAAIRDIHSRGKTPIVCGGTGLYVNSLIDNRQFVSENSDGSVPEGFSEEYAQAVGHYNSGNAAGLHGILEKYDPEAAGLYHPNNVKRVLRAVKLYFITGLTRVEREADSLRSRSDIAFLTFVLSPDRDDLYANIDRRVDIMREQGLYDEAVYVYELCRRHIAGEELSLPEGSGLTDETAFDHRNLNSLAAIGYREFYDILGQGLRFADGAALDTCFDKIKQDTRRYAKRQITWFKKTPGARFI